MNRLTKKSGFDYIPRHMFRDYDAVLNDTELQQAYSHATNKLGELEDIEEELGIDLITLFKALKDGIYYKMFVGHIILDNVVSLDYDYDYDEPILALYSEESNSHYNFKDYGKTWALTKEELEND